MKIFAIYSNLVLTSDCNNQTFEHGLTKFDPQKNQYTTNKLLDEFNSYSYESSVCVDFSKVIRARRTGILVYSLPELQDIMFSSYCEGQYSYLSSYSLRGFVLSNNGIGKGNIVGAFNTWISPAVLVEATATLGTDPELTVSSTYNYKDSIKTTLEVSANSLQSIPQTGFAVVYRLSKNVDGSFIIYFRIFYI
jgi:hypothetical protein